ncbi:patatin [Mesorhizobium sp. M7A.F.Ca.US.014.04.1.1]|uniref:patatin-like phospholipase family protein n=1 Tax=Mesorhizobium TaxID=68287 RepID=UPI0009EF3A7E|nr:MULTISPECIES: patatin-like phospholipase family protein [Mesorhizobium]MDF3233856.1 patatin-like phospholipase family protein [Mesorhizobium sp. DSM 30133]RUU16371.1 patatin [Mesorhizobium sp. Primo-B]RUU34510.1 patatin [Mesorhizobium sp. Primo-A]RUX58548.1 patatin [Mesorhizobium sp. M7A.F.Ca.US.014.04.1.1]RVB90008.1 patatin [Mesorhizobium sp. M7A.F.Ca.AU.002.03.1.1]
MEEAAELTTPVGRPFRVLCLDGGGMRGIYTAAFLDRLLDQYRRTRGEEHLDLGGGFDLIAGTSTGAIIACAAAIGRPMSDLVRLYQVWGRKIFPERITESRVKLIARIAKGGSIVRAGDAALREALRVELGDITMLDVYRKRGISLSIPTVAMSTHRAWVFKKTKTSGVRDDNYKLVDICLASSAAPIYRSLAAIKNPDSKHEQIEVFADGGLWANNPVMVGMLDALMNADEGQPIQIFSLGTCSRPEGEEISSTQVHRSMLQWKLGADVAPLSITAQEFAFDNMARMFANVLSKCGREVHHVRFPQQKIPASKLEYLGLDDSRSEAMNALLSQASTDADMVKSACDDPRNPQGQLIHNLMMSLPTMPEAGVPKEFFE